MRILVNQGVEIAESVMRHAVQYPEPEIIDFLRLSGGDYGPREMASLGRLEDLRAVIDADPSILRKRVGQFLPANLAKNQPCLGLLYVGAMRRWRIG